MYNAVNGFVDALRFGSVIMATRLTLYQGGQSTGVLLPVSTANFTADRNSAQRRSGELTVELLPTVPPQQVVIGGQSYNLLPLDPSSPLAPFGNEIFVEMAVWQAQEPPENWGWVPLGMYVIAHSDIVDSGIDLVCTLRVFDRSWRFSRWQLLNNYTLPQADGSLQGEVVALLSLVWNQNGPGRFGTPVPDYISFPNIGLSNWVCPAGTYQQGQDPWAACLQMAQSAAFELYFDIQGRLTGIPIPGGPVGSPLSSLPVVWNFFPGEVTAVGTFNHALAGTPYTTPVSLVDTLTQENVFNDWMVSATGPNNATGTNVPIQAQAQDTNPQSPTFVNSGLGDIPNFVYDGNITSYNQALAEAQYDLAVSISSAWQLGVSTPLNPLLDIDDVVTVTQPRLALDHQKMIIDSISLSVRYDEATMVSGRVIQS